MIVRHCEQQWLVPVWCVFRKLVPGRLFAMTTAKGCCCKAFRLSWQCCGLQSPEQPWKATHIDDTYQATEERNHTSCLPTSRPKAGEVEPNLVQSSPSAPQRKQDAPATLVFAQPVYCQSLHFLPTPHATAFKASLSSLVSISILRAPFPAPPPPQILNIVTELTTV